ncbi:acyl-CoA dehydrogenase family protein [Fimbriimonas ginsengisoli]|uniref:Acyl-CoA dehydrogenase n=1 Tax=Fimbriimonas ginsengisoli Gsoil 348 TaxID=661478 RepID=A0A068NY67_FIMGI|nr:acyl-CoA dehydrogenase family protein [Fimbriimonas ginsengisoli]AIE87885.1 acyl-CoA dehydrogenase [Fimbriimonas ginsengisoli Gsoil 348]
MALTEFSARTNGGPNPFDMHLDENSFLERVRAFVADEVLPKTREWESNRAFPDSIWPRLGELGILAMTLPREKGGLGLTCTTYCDTIREIAKGDPALAMNVAAINALCVAHFDRFATQEQCDKYLPGIIKGEIKLAWGLTEPDAGSDARRVKTKATPIEERPGYYKINGRKMFITNAGKADLIVLIARTSDTELTAFLVETDQLGFTNVERIHTVGVSASWTTSFDLKDAVGWHTPCKFEDAIGLLYRGRLAIAGMALGIAEKAHELTVEYSKQREQFNRRLCDMQSVQNMIADSEMEITAARLLLHHGTTLFDEGKPVIKESSMAKLYASETSNRVTNRAIQIHGGRGMTPEYLVEKLWRDAKLTEIGEGCSEIQRMVIAKQVTR